MKIFKIVLSILFLSIFSVGIYCQDVKDVQDEIENDILETLTGINPLNNPENISSGNINILNQVGKENEAIIVQSRSVQNYGNIAIINQVGSNNKSKIVQIGNENYSVSGQLGNYNESELSLEGANNFVGVFQIGNYNQFSQDFKGNNINFAILQQGTFNQFKQVNQTHQPDGLRIIQTGNGIKTVITNGPGNTVNSK